MALARLIGALIVCCILFAGQDALARTPLIVVFTPWFPYTYTEDGEAKGYEIEILRAVFKRMDVEATYVERPWKRCLLMLAHGEADVLSSMLRTPARETYALIPDRPISCSRVVLFSRKSANIAFDGSLRSIQGSTIGYTLGFDYGEGFEKADYLVKDSGLNARSIVKKVVGRRNDLGIENEIVIKAAAKDLGLSTEIKILSPAVFTKDLFVGFSKKTVSQNFAANFSSELARFQESPEYQEIVERYDITCP